MKNYLLLVAILGIFFWFGVATSPPQDDFPPNKETYPSTIEALSDAIVLTSESDIAIENGVLNLTRGTSSITIFTISNYDLAANGTDTLPFSDFMLQDSIPFPSGETPSFFNLDFFTDNLHFFKNYEF